MKTTATRLLKKLSKTILVFITSLWLSGFSKVLAQNNFAIPDANFAAWLNVNIPSAMSGGNLMDTTDVTVTTLTQIVIFNNSITDLSGIQYFTALLTLFCENNQLTSLPSLPNSLTEFYCANNQLTSLPALPDSLTVLDCNANQLMSLPALPNSITYLDCYQNLLTGLSSLPDSLKYFYCGSNQLTNLPTLPSSLTHFECANNQLTFLPALPSSLIYLYCNNNQLTSLPNLPNGVGNLNCNFNQLTSLPVLPNSLVFLRCSNNQLMNLPVLPSGLNELICYGNQLTNLPILPNSIEYLFCNNNNIFCFPIFPNIINGFDISNNPFACLPNYIPIMNQVTLAYPLCLPGNSNGCDIANGIVGFTYKDMNTNCAKDNGDQNLLNIPLKIYDSSNNLVNQTYTDINGAYYFFDTAGTYTVLIDTTGMPFAMQCAYPGLDSTIILTDLDTNVNFSLTCKPGFDVGVQSVVSNGLVFPGQAHSLSVNAGDMMQWYNLNCATGISGTVQISVTGPVTFMGPAIGALTPAVAGNVFTYTIADFASVNNSTAFNLLFSTDTTAQAGDVICVNVTVTPGIDINMSNNAYQYCYSVVNSLDPNIKEVYPVNVLPGFQDWFTYTIHFQNTGSAAAINIRLTDTLDANLNLETFQVINYSHQNAVSLNGNMLTVRYPNINLPDSTSNPSGSIGFIQYRIKPKPNLPNGTVINNTCNIYFDYNSAIVTNTTQNLFTNSASVAELPYSRASISVYPNPFTDNTTFVIKSEKMNEVYSFEMIDVLGKTVKSLNGISKKQFQISGNGLETGMYFYKIYSAEGIIGNGKVVIK